MTEQIIGLPHLRILKIIVQETRHDDARWNQEDYFAIRKYVEDTVDGMESQEAVRLQEAAAQLEKELAEAAKPTEGESMPAGVGQTEAELTAHLEKYDELLKAINDLPDEKVKQIKAALAERLEAAVGEEVKKEAESGAAVNETAGIQEPEKAKVEEYPPVGKSAEEHPVMEPVKGEEVKNG